MLSVAFHVRISHHHLLLLLLLLRSVTGILPGPSALSLPSPPYGTAQGASAVSMWVKAASAPPCSTPQQQQRSAPPAAGSTTSGPSNITTTSDTTTSSSSSSSGVKDPDLHWLPLLTQAAGGAVKAPDALSVPSVPDDEAGVETINAGSATALYTCGSRLAVAVGAAGSPVHGLVRVTVKVRHA
jgi:hypothetical protein